MIGESSVLIVTTASALIVIPQALLASTEYRPDSVTCRSSLRLQLETAAPSLSHTVEKGIELSAVAVRMTWLPTAAITSFGWRRKTGACASARSESKVQRRRQG